MNYPPSWRHISDFTLASQLMSEHPFAHLITAVEGPHATRIPFVTDVEDDQPIRLRAHLNGKNPQVRHLDGASVLVVFSGPHSYVSPHWRTAPTRGGTYDYEEVQVRGTAHVVGDIGDFCRLIDDLSSLIEPQYAEVGDYPVWNTAMAPAGYVERLFPQIVAFEVVIESIQTVSKLHQPFPEEDRISVAEHLGRSRREDARAIADKIRASIATTRVRRQP
ncbi:MAG: FMN-binding negative transcriptional regulator [Xanthomonadales bacterium]|nr:FMN-binding negative transcriptional regulator [Xanthomonadales bacterium]MCB1636047.1 FMN-binding negative transcriptional regulator [Xanthomonadales bacterium]